MGLEEKMIEVMERLGDNPREKSLALDIEDYDEPKLLNIGVVLHRRNHKSGVVIAYLDDLPDVISNLSDGNY